MGKQDRQFNKKWSKQIGSLGHTMIPNLLIWYAGQLNITAPEFMLLSNLESYRWETRYPFPSVETLAISMGVTPRTITRTATSLVKKGYIKRGKHHAQLNEYDITPLIIRLNKLASSSVGHSDEQPTTQGGKERPAQTDINVSITQTKMSAEEDPPNQDSFKTHLYSQDFINEATDRTDLYDIKDSDTNVNLDETHKHEWREYEVEKYKGEEPYTRYYFTCEYCGLQYSKNKEKPWPAEYPLLNSD